MLFDIHTLAWTRWYEMEREAEQRRRWAWGGTHIRKSVYKTMVRTLGKLATMIASFLA